MKEVNEEELLAAIAALHVIVMPDGQPAVFCDAKLAAKYLNGFPDGLVLRRTVEIRISVTDNSDETAKVYKADITCCIDGDPVITTSEQYPSVRNPVGHVIRHLNEYLAAGIRFGFCEAEAFNHCCEGSDKKAVAQLKEYLHAVLEKSKKRLQIFPARRMQVYRKGMERAGLLATYESLYELCRPVKAYHDQSYKEFCRRQQRRTREEWRVVWRESAQKIYPDLPPLFLDYFSLPENSSASQIAKAAIADQHNYSRTYLDKLLNQARKEKHSLPYYKAITKSEGPPIVLHV